MIGPALSQLFSDLAEIPATERTEYEAQLYRELDFLSMIKEDWLANVNIVDNDRSAVFKSYNVTLEAIYSESEVPSKVANVIKSEMLRFPIDYQMIAARKQTYSGRTGRPSCPRPDCPNKRQ
jgi:hypothetical protein